MLSEDPGIIEADASAPETNGPTLGSSPRSLLVPPPSSHFRRYAANSPLPLGLATIPTGRDATFYLVVYEQGESPSDAIPSPYSSRANTKSVFYLDSSLFLLRRLRAAVMLC